MDVESVAVELYERVPAEFTKVRDEYVASARKAGDRQLAAAIAALRKPTVAMWTAGLLARRRPEEARSLIRLGEALRAAHRTLDAGQLRKLSHDQHVVIGELARTARALAAEAGQAVSEPVLHEVEQIFHAVLADPDVAERWAEGRLVRAPDAVSGFTGLEPEPGAAPPRRKQPGPAGSRPERVEAARTALAEARGEVERVENEHAAAQELADRAGAAVREAEEDVRAAGERLETARAASAEAATALRDAERAAAKVRRQAEAAARKAERLTSSEG
ncbi:hypothetical protein OG304_32640 [Streptomyces sp. NBC_00160]|uniref:hypothetical protein n=1 Tax=Streptomyces sp. NBC_00160 TaxID=2903628 RepID=UPI00224CCEE0|nr:hypothetical protein [Streptomyces sp. NBC_00160]MCX5308152.1 hypothetical protein [Streptomyces sp. NBC_00160]